MVDQVGSGPGSLRRANTERLLAYLLEHGATHRARLARELGLSRTTISTIANGLVARGLLVRTDPAAGVVDGRAREFLTIRPRAAAVAGLGFTRDQVWVQVVDLLDREIAHGQQNLSYEDDWRTLLRHGLDVLDRTLGEAGLTRADLTAVCVGVPGQVATATGVVRSDLPQNAWSGAVVGDELGTWLRVPYVVDNNSRLAGLAEAVHGAGRGSHNMLYIELSTGIGSCLLLDNRMYRGALGGAGEIGHLSICQNGPLCTCGNRGCLVLYAGTPAILAALTPVHGPDLDIDRVVRLALDGDRACGTVLHEAGQAVGRALAGLVNLLDPDLIVLGGKVTRAGDALLDTIRGTLRRHALSPPQDTTLVAAHLDAGAHASALGGAALLLHNKRQLAQHLRHTSAGQPKGRAVVGE